MSHYSHNNYTIADKYVPYNVSVKASTSAGFGLPTSNITFTEEGSKLLMTIMVGNMQFPVCTTSEDTVHREVSLIEDSTFTIIIIIVIIMQY